MEKYIEEEDVLITNKNIFGDEEEHIYDLRCFDGYAECEPQNDSDPELVMIYPKIEEVRSDETMSDHILKYRGLCDLSADDITFGDIAITYGKI